MSEAAEWLLRLNEEGRSSEVLSEWQRWCNADAENLAAFESLRDDWRDLDAMRGALAVSRDCAPPAKNATVARSLSTWRQAAVIAAVTVIVLAGGYHWRQSQEPLRQVAATTTNKAATLPDGSSVILSARTRVSVDFSDHKRRLDLSAGEAYFKVEREEQRPFIVHAGEIDVTAIGTAFNVRHERDRIAVTVEEGIVEVSAGLAGRTPSTWRVLAGHQLSYSTRDRTATLISVDPSVVLMWRSMWRSGRLAYDWKPLSVVIDDINRYSSRRIVTATDLTQMRFTGTVFTNSIDDWLNAIEETYSVRAERLSNGDIVLHAHSVSSAGD